MFSLAFYKIPFSAIRVNYQLNANICLFGSTCFGLYAHLQEQIEFILQMRHMVPLLQPGVLRSVRAGGEVHSYWL